MLLIITVVFLLLYALLFSFYFYHWRWLKGYISEENGQPAFISVIVAARNEEENIERLLTTLQRQTYPKDLYEIIIVDDYSTDKTREKIESFPSDQVRLVKPNVAAHLSSKKRAIEAGVENAKGNLIVVTDADCIPGCKWVETVANFYQVTNAVFIAAPVKLKSYPTLLSIFQSLDFITLQGITAASVQAHFHSMCNGANLAYSREAFLEVNGFEGIDKVASGDDMLLMYKIWKKHPDKVLYLKDKEAIMETEPAQTWKAFIHQRIRWSSKATYYDDHRVTAVLMFVFLLNCLFFVLLFSAFLNESHWWTVLFYLTGKTLIEIPFVASVASFYDQRRLVIFFPLLQPLHIAYVVSIGFISQFGKYEWKGRKTK